MLVIDRPNPNTNLDLTLRLRRDWDLEFGLSSGLSKNLYFIPRHAKYVLKQWKVWCNLFCKCVDIKSENWCLLNKVFLQKWKSEIILSQHRNHVSCTAKIIVLSQKETVLWNSAIGSGSSGSSLTKAPRESGRSSPSSSSSLSSIFGSTLMSLYDRFWPTKRIVKWKYQLFVAIKPHDISCAFFVSINYLWWDHISYPEEVVEAGWSWSEVGAVSCLPLASHQEAELSWPGLTSGCWSGGPWHSSAQVWAW